MNLALMSCVRPASAARSVDHARGGFHALLPVSLFELLTLCAVVLRRLLKGKSLFLEAHLLLFASFD
jgi:hypothetical protein